MVIMRSSSGMNLERTFKTVVLPDPVEPETTMLIFADTQARKKWDISVDNAPKLSRSSTVNGSAANFRIVIVGPLMVRGGMIALTREPSGVAHQPMERPRLCDGRGAG